MIVFFYMAKAQGARVYDKRVGVQENSGAKTGEDRR
jgi:hypothetical protein